MALSKAQLLKAPHLETREFDIHGLEDPVRLRELSTRQRLVLTDGHSAADSLVDTTRGSLRLVAAALVDANDDRLFPGDDVEAGVEALMDLSMKTVEELIDATMKVNGLGKEELKAEVGNSAGEASSASSSS